MKIIGYLPRLVLFSHILTEAPFFTWAHGHPKSRWYHPLFLGRYGVVINFRTVRYSKSDLRSFPVFPVKERVIAVFSISLPLAGMAGAGAAILGHGLEASQYKQQSNKVEGAQFLMIMEPPCQSWTIYPDSYVSEKWHFILFSHHCFESLWYSIRTNLPNQTFSQSDSIENKEMY